MLDKMVQNKRLKHYSTLLLRVCGVVFGSTAAYIIGYVHSVKRHHLREVCSASTGTASSSVHQTVSALRMHGCTDRGDSANVVFKHTVVLASTVHSKS